MQDNDLDEAAKRDLVGEAFHTFGESWARDLAVALDIDFEECGDAIERFARRFS